MEKVQIFPAEWMSLTRETRTKLIDMFNIKRDIATEVDSIRGVICDGYSANSIAGITLEAMQEKGFEGKDFMDAFNKILDSFEKVEEPKVEEVEELKVEEPVKVKKQIKKKVKK